ncbi:MAG: peptidoglycan bridge formation glycyltransferase FemA/FemB family protein, partial [Methanobacteriaceae archaeon]|nr:peptidoglycan bridge formation glycyltransferase FemA/FemB family protein [Methanobacteriaceae archaeon]
MIDISFRKVSINDIDESQRSDLDRLMDSDRTSTVFNDVGLALIYQKHFPRSRMYTYQIFYKSDMIGYFVSNEVFKCGLKYVYSPPVNSLFPYGGVVVHSDFAKESQFICNKLLTSIMRPNCSLYIASNPDQCCFDSSAGSTSLMNIPTLFIDVSLGRDEIWRLMENLTRRNIKKALKNSVTVKKKSLEDFSSVADHLRIYRQLCERKGLTYVSDDYYYDIMRYVSDKYHLDVYYGVCN